MNYQNLNATSFIRTLNNETDAKLIDVRSFTENAESRLKGSIVIDIKQADFIEELEELDKSLPYFLYCEKGLRSQNACQYMCSIGFKRVFNLEGGLKHLKSQITSHPDLALYFET